MDASSNQIGDPKVSLELTKRLITVPIDDLTPFPGNPRSNTQSAKIVAESIKSYGYINPIIVDENLTILAGNTRYKAMKLLKAKHIEVLQVEGLSDEQKHGFVIADNKVGEFSKWNMAAMNRMLEAQVCDPETLKKFGIKNAHEVKAELEALIHDRAK